MHTNNYAQIKVTHREQGKLDIDMGEATFGISSYWNDFYLQEYVNRYKATSCFVKPKLKNIILVLICKHFICSELRDFCQSDKLEAACGGDEVIVMDAAEYGRMELTKDGQVPHLTALFVFFLGGGLFFFVCSSCHATYSI